MRLAATIPRLRDLYATSRLTIAVIVGGAAFLAAPAGLGTPLRATLAWVIFVTAYLSLILLAIGDATPTRARLRARELDERAWVVFIIIVASAAVSLLALGFVLRKGETPTMARVALACLAVAASWFLAHTSFALHYAHTYYGDPDKDGSENHGLDFPGKEEPDYWDFLYYSFVVGMTCQVSDVQVSTREMRRLTLSHGVLSFFFNTGVLALSVNILAGAL
jgi:uncharacterized membrane protein